MLYIKYQYIHKTLTQAKFNLFLFLIRYQEIKSPNLKKCLWIYEHPYNWFLKEVVKLKISHLSLRVEYISCFYALMKFLGLKKKAEKYFPLIFSCNSQNSPKGYNNITIVILSIRSVRLKEY